jgi:hypothetical protein
MDIAPVRDPRHVDGSGRIVNDVNYAVVTNTNPPFLIAAFESFAARRTGRRNELFKTQHNTANYFLGQPCNSFPALETNATR